MRARRGSLPDGSQLTIGDVEPLRGAADPEGRFWCSDVGEGDASAVTTQLAGIFPDTGLWPLIWDFDDDPAGYVIDPANPDDLGKFTAAEVLRTAWQDFRDELGPRDFADLSDAGLAAASSPDPFAEINARPFRDAQPVRRLLLVACERPADALAMMGWAYSTIPLVMTAAVLRSWEQRLGAVLVQVAPDNVVLSVGAPPTSDEEALAVAEELVAITRGALLPGTQVSDVAGLLIGAHADDAVRSQFDLSPMLWRICFHEDVSDGLEELAESRDVRVGWDV